MSRANYSEDCYGWELICWRGAVKSAIRGKRGQDILSDMAKALDAMPIKRLISEELISKEGEVCALGAVAKYKSLPVDNIDPQNAAQVSRIFNIAEALAREIAYINDDGYSITPEDRWKVVRKWVKENLKYGQ